MPFGLSYTRLLLVLTGLAIGGGLLWYVAQSINLEAAAFAFKNASRSWVLGGVALFILSTAVRALRWHYLISFLGRTSLGTVGEVLVIGHAINFIVPARLGELYRADKLARKTGFSRSAVLGTIFVERCIDLAFIILLLALGLSIVSVPSALLGTALISTMLILSCAAAIAFLGLRYNGRSRQSPILDGRILPRAARVWRHIHGWIDSFSQSLGVLSTRQFAIAICISVPIWGLECLAVMSILRSLGIGVGAEGLMLAVSSGSISTIIPSAPGFVGSYNFAYVIALGLVGVDATLAVVASTSVMVHLFGSVVVLAFLIAVAVFLSRIRQTQRT